MIADLMDYVNGLKLTWHSWHYIQESALSRSRYDTGEFMNASTAKGSRGTYVCHRSIRRILLISNLRIHHA